MSNAKNAPRRSADALADSFITASRALVGIAVRSVQFAPVEVTVGQHRLLVLLAAGGEQTIGALAQQLGVDQSNASRLCDRLQRLHLVTKQRSKSDGRAVEVALTDAGKDLLEVVSAHRRDEVKRILKRLPRHDVDSMIEILTRFNQAADELAEPEWVTQAR